MALFSQRKGIRPAEKMLQRESMDDDLCNCLWNALKIFLWDKWSSGYRDDQDEIQTVVERVWLHYFKSPIDTLPEFHSRYGASSYGMMRDYFFKSKWYERYDFIEFTVINCPEKWKGDLKEHINYISESENSAYRIVGDEIIEITDNLEIQSIETAIETGIESVRLHLDRSLALLSDRKQPDYRNSIKEAVSAVESTCQIISGMPKATLGNCIKTIKDKGNVHPAFEQALLKLYGYSSNEGEIRHALTEESIEPTYSDAKIMLVACSAFVNFIWTKASELGISIK